jgi:hypothetical protein
MTAPDLHPHHRRDPPSDRRGFPDGAGKPDPVGNGSAKPNGDGKGNGAHPVEDEDTKWGPIYDFGRSFRKIRCLEDGEKHLLHCLRVNAWTEDDPRLDREVVRALYEVHKLPPPDPNAPPRLFTNRMSNREMAKQLGRNTSPRSVQRWMWILEHAAKTAIVYRQKTNDGENLRNFHQVLPERILALALDPAFRDRPEHWDLLRKEAEGVTTARNPPLPTPYADRLEAWRVQAGLHPSDKTIRELKPIVEKVDREEVRLPVAREGMAKREQRQIARKAFVDAKVPHVVRVETDAEERSATAAASSSPVEQLGDADDAERVAGATLLAQGLLEVDEAEEPGATADPAATRAAEARAKRRMQGQIRGILLRLPELASLADYVGETPKGEPCAAPSLIGITARKKQRSIRDVEEALARMALKIGSPDPRWAKYAHLRDLDDRALDVQRLKIARAAVREQWATDDCPVPAGEPTAADLDAYFARAGTSREDLTAERARRAARGAEMERIALALGRFARARGALEGLGPGAGQEPGLAALEVRATVQLVMRELHQLDPEAFPDRSVAELLAGRVRRAAERRDLAARARDTLGEIARLLEGARAPSSLPQPAAPHQPAAAPRPELGPAERTKPPAMPSRAAPPGRDVFDQAVDAVRAKSPILFDQWFRDVQFDGLADGVLSLRVANTFTIELVSGHVGQILEQLRPRTGPLRVEWTEDAALAHPIAPPIGAKLPSAPPPGPAPSVPDATSPRAPNGTPAPAAPLEDEVGALAREILACLQAHPKLEALATEADARKLAEHAHAKLAPEFKIEALIDSVRLALLDLDKSVRGGRYGPHLAAALKFVEIPRKAPVSSLQRGGPWRPKGRLA